MTALRYRSCPRRTRPVSAVLHGRLVAVGGQRAGQRRADELAVFLVRLLEQARRHAALRVVLEVGVGDGAQAIVGLVERRRHHFARARIVEPRQQHQRAEADVAVRVAGGRLDQRRHRLRGGRAADDARRAAVRDGGVELAEIVDRRLELRAATSPASPSGLLR